MKLLHFFAHLGQFGGEIELSVKFRAVEQWTEYEVRCGKFLLVKGISPTMLDAVERVTEGIKQHNRCIEKRP